MPKFTRDGVKLHYELDGSGPPVVYITGFGDHPNSAFSQPFRQILAQAYTVLAVDSRGAGQTVTPPGSAATIEDMADDVAAIMDHHQLGPAHVLGISMGGMIALTLALGHPRAVRSQVVAVSSAWMEYPGRTAHLVETERLLKDAGVADDLLARVSLSHVLGEAIFRDAEFITMAINAPADPLAQTRAGYDMQRDAIMAYDIRARLGDIATPTRIISSPDDLLVPPHYQEELAKGIPGAEFKGFPGGHVFMMLPQYFQPFVDDVLAFWKKHS